MKILLRHLCDLLFWKLLLLLSMSYRKELFRDREFVGNFLDGWSYYRARLNILPRRYIANPVFLSALACLSLLEGLTLRGTIEFRSTPLLF